MFKIIYRKKEHLMCAGFLAGSFFFGITEDADKFIEFSPLKYIPDFSEMEDDFDTYSPERKTAGIFLENLSYLQIDNEVFIGHKTQIREEVKENI